MRYLMTSINTKKTAIASVLAVAAIAAPSASAAPIEEHLPSAVNVPAVVNAGLGPSGGSDGSRAVVGQTPPSTGFDWGDAGVGAAGMLALIGLGAGAVAITRRSERRDAVAS
jgi:hypothetical protein